MVETVASMSIQHQFKMTAIRMLELIASTSQVCGRPAMLSRNTGLDEQQGHVADVPLNRESGVCVQACTHAQANCSDKHLCGNAADVLPAISTTSRRTQLVKLMQSGLSIQIFRRTACCQMSLNGMATLWQQWMLCKCTPPRTNTMLSSCVQAGCLHTTSATPRVLAVMQECCPGCVLQPWFWIRRCCMAQTQSLQGYVPTTLAPAPAFLVLTLALMCPEHGKRKSRDHLMAPFEVQAKTLFRPVHSP